MLKAIAGRGFPNIKISAIHIHGDYSCGAGVHVEYLKNLCEALNITFVSVPSKQTIETLECYSCSRERRRLLFNAAKKLGATAVAFGHHRDDSIQTLMMNLLHKGEFCGNLPKLEMVDFGITILRPLIYVPESEVIAFAEIQGFRRVMCQCPVGQRSMRKKVDTLLDDIETLFPNVRENLARSVHLYGSDKAKSQKSQNH